MSYLVDHEGITSFKLFMAYPGVLLQRRRPDPAGHADRRRMRGDDHDARRERHRHRRAACSRPLARGETDPEVPQLHPAVAARGRGHPPGHRAGHVAGNVPLYVVHMSAGDALDEVAAARHRRPQRVRRDVPAVPLPHARRDPRPSPASRVPSGCAAPRCAARITIPITSARWATATRATCGRACA